MGLDSSEAPFVHLRRSQARISGIRVSRGCDTKSNLCVRAQGGADFTIGALAILVCCHLGKNPVVHSVAKKKRASHPGRQRKGMLGVFGDTKRIMGKNKHWAARVLA